MGLRTDADHLSYTEPYVITLLVVSMTTGKIIVRAEAINLRPRLFLPNRSETTMFSSPRCAHKV